MSIILRFVPSGGGWKVTVIFGFLNHELATNLDDHDILGHLKQMKDNFLMT